MLLARSFLELLVEILVRKRDLIMRSGAGRLLFLSGVLGDVNLFIEFTLMKLLSVVVLLIKEGLQLISGVLSLGSLLLSNFLNSLNVLSKLLTLLLPSHLTLLISLHMVLFEIL